MLNFLGWNIRKNIEKQFSLLQLPFFEKILGLPTTIKPSNGSLQPLIMGDSS